MLYHPDKLNFYKNKIIELKHKNEFDSIEKYFHIVNVLENLDNMTINHNYDDPEIDIEYECDPLTSPI